MAIRYREYFRGDGDSHWPKGDVFVDVGYTDPAYFTVNLQVGSCVTKMTREEADDLHNALTKALNRLNELQRGAQ